MDAHRMEKPHRGMPPLVLTVEDDDLLRAVYKQLFASSGFRCIACSRPDEALHVLLAKPPNLVLLDYDLPGMPGPELAQVIRAVWPHIPLMLLTGRTYVATEVRSYFDAVHLKGEDPAALLSQVHRLSSRSSPPGSSASGDGFQPIPVRRSDESCIPPPFATDWRSSYAGDT